MPGREQPVYGFLYVAANLGFALGAGIGGLLASLSFSPGTRRAGDVEALLLSMGGLALTLTLPTLNLVLPVTMGSRGSRTSRRRGGSAGPCGCSWWWPPDYISFPTSSTGGLRRTSLLDLSGRNDDGYLGRGFHASAYPAAVARLSPPDRRGSFQGAAGRLSGLYGVPRVRLAAAGLAPVSSLASSLVTQIDSTEVEA